MPRGKGKSVDFDLQDDELPFLGSQDSNGSNGSEDNAFQLAFAEQYIATREKRKKEQQRKFLAGAKKLVSKEIKSSAEVIIEAARSVDELFQAFTINYATEEDCIRGLWLAIVEEERKLQNLSKRFHSAVIKEGEECETEQIKGMGKAQEAVLGACSHLMSTAIFCACDNWECIKLNILSRNATSHRLSLLEERLITLGS
ncbi:MAG: hypothetical protein NXY57DRAFT_52074 [Lentinula lateritia]|nr:MAG: hypothetical protein NXY57DRAFT_52074 [Lentinula lateritia]